MQTKKSGFSLMEMGIIIVIVGLLIGAVSVGANMMRAAEIRTILEEKRTFETAIANFQAKFDWLPGDMPNATSVWGSAACPGGAATGTQTCNGNGDNLVTYGAASQLTEAFTFWQQLGHAGFIDGTYSGRAGATTAENHDFGVNAPASGYSSGGIGWGATWVDNRDSAIANMWDRNMLSWLTIGADDGTHADGTEGMLFIKEAYNMDLKVDDSLPGNGTMVVHDATLCSDAADGSAWRDASYDLADADTSCSIAFSHVSVGR